MLNAYTSEASIKVLTVKMLFDFHKLRGSLFGRTDRLGSSVRSGKQVRNAEWQVSLLMRCALPRGSPKRAESSFGGSRDFLAY